MYLDQLSLSYYYQIIITIQIDIINTEEKKTIWYGMGIWNNYRIRPQEKNRQKNQNIITAN